MATSPATAGPVGELPGWSNYEVRPVDRTTPRGAQRKTEVRAAPYFFWG
jgi:hypothetical protein